jgi:hypothetical protein
LRKRGAADPTENFIEKIGKVIYKKRVLEKHFTEISFLETMDMI